MHLPRSYLNLKRNTVASDNSSMKRAVHVRLRHRDVVLESARNRFEHIVYLTKHRVAFLFGINDYTQSIEIVYFVKVFALIVHLAVERIYGFDSSLNAESDTRLR